MRAAQELDEHPGLSWLLCYAGRLIVERKAFTVNASGTSRLDLCPHLSFVSIRSVLNGFSKCCTKRSEKAMQFSLKCKMCRESGGDELDLRLERTMRSFSGTARYVYDCLSIFSSDFEDLIHAFKKRNISLCNAVTVVIVK